MTCVLFAKAAGVHVPLAPLMDILGECKMIVLAVPFPTSLGSSGMR